MEEMELVESYRNRVEIKYSVKSAKDNVREKVFNLKSKLSSKQLSDFCKIEVALKEYEEVLIKDIFEFVLEFLQKKNTNF